MTNILLKKIYYYIICLFAVFVLIWGSIDTVSGIVSFMFYPSQGLEQSMEEPSPEKEGGVSPFVESYYQRQMILDRIGDSLSRIFVAIVVLSIGSWRLKTLDKKE